MEGINCIPWAHEAGIENISIDLIFAIPNQDNELLKKNLEIATRLNPTQIGLFTYLRRENCIWPMGASKESCWPWTRARPQHSLNWLWTSSMMWAITTMRFQTTAYPAMSPNTTPSHWQQKKYLGIGPVLIRMMVLADNLM